MIPPMQIENSGPRWGLIVGLFVILGVLAGLPFLLYRKPKNLPLYQVQNFIGPVEIYSSKTKSWSPVRRGDSLGNQDKVRTGPQAEIDLGIADQFSFRVKENSQFEVRGSKLFSKNSGYHIHLVRGSLLGSGQKNYSGSPIEVSTPTLTASFESPMFHMAVKPETSDSVVHVLEGLARVHSAKSPRIVIVHSLEKTEVGRNSVLIEASPVTRQEWNQMREAYELTTKSAAVEAKQLDLSKMAGELFLNNVFDHGTFYTPEFGHAEREFIKGEDGKIYLKADYDVFPTGSFVGVYIKTRNLDLAKYQGFKFQAKVNAQEGYPASMRIEFKTATGLARVFVPRDFKPTWQTFVYPLIVRQPTPVTEIVLVFSNEKVGNFKKGTIYLRDFSLEPASSTPPAVLPPAAQNKSRTLPSTPRATVQNSLETA